MTTLFERYAPTPRPPSLAPTLHSHYRKAWLVVVGTLAGALVAGVPLSFIRFRASRGWDPIDMLICGAVLAVFTVPLAAIGVVIFRRYVRLFRTGRLVEAVVLENRPVGAVLEVAVGVGPDRTLIPQAQLPVGARLPAIIGGAASSYTLVVVGEGDVRRGSLLTEAQAAAMGRAAA